jgi:hypothetical protein
LPTRCQEGRRSLRTYSLTERTIAVLAVHVIYEF